MTTIQIIELDGHPVAAVVGDKAIIADHVTGADRPVGEAGGVRSPRLGSPVPIRGAW